MARGNSIEQETDIDTIIERDYANGMQDARNRLCNDVANYVNIEDRPVDAEELAAFFCGGVFYFGIVQFNLYIHDMHHIIKTAEDRGLLKTQTKKTAHGYELVALPIDWEPRR